MLRAEGHAESAERLAHCDSEARADASWRYERRSGSLL